MPRPGRAQRATALALAFALGVAGEALAQYNKTEPPITRFQVGPIRFNPKLELRNAGKDTNAVLDPTNPVTDNSIVVRGTLVGFMPVRTRLRLYGEGWLDWSYFQSFSSETSWDPGGQGHAELDFGPLTLTGGGGALQARQLYSIDIDQRILRQERWVNGGLEWRLTRRLVFSGGAEHREYRFDPSAGLAQAATAATLNRNNLTGTVAMRYKLTSMTTAVANADVIQDEFQLGAPGLDTTRSYRYLGGLEFGKTALLNGRFLAGVRDFPASSAGTLPSYTGLAMTGQLAWPILTRVRLIGTAGRDVYVSSIPVRSIEERGRNTFVRRRGGPGSQAHRPGDVRVHGRELPPADDGPGHPVRPRRAPLHGHRRPAAPLLRQHPDRRPGDVLPAPEHDPEQLLRPLALRFVGGSRALIRLD